MKVRNIFRNNMLAGLLLILLVPSAHSEPWPTTQFEVIESSNFEESGNPNWLAGNFDLIDDDASIPLTPALKALIEQYLSAVATQYKSWGLPAPHIDLVERADGAKAYRVQYYDLNDGYAFFGPKCGSTKVSTIHLNAKKLTRNGSITNKGYVDMAHEFFHAVEGNSNIRLDACGKGIEYGKWITEGLAEAIGQDMAWQLVGSKGTASGSINPQRRPLAVPLNSDGIAEYQSSSFWRYLAELKYLSTPKNAASKPGPEKPAGFEQGNTGTDYSYVAGLFEKPISGKGPAKELEWLEGHLKTSFKSELSHIYIDFVSVLAQYGLYRVEGQSSRFEIDVLWRDNVFEVGGSKGNGVTCEPMSIGLSAKHATLNVELAKVATRCIELDVGDTGTPLAWNVEVVAENETLLKQVRMGMAGGKEIFTSGVFKLQKNSSGATVEWAVTLEPGKKQYLLLANVAKSPWRTESQTVQLFLTLEGRQDNLAPSQPGTRTSTGHSPDATPGPAGADDARQQSSAEMGYQPIGSGSADWSYEDATEFCTRKSRAKGNCHTEAELVFTTAAPPNLMIAQLGNASQAMNTMSGDAAGMMRFMEFEDATDGTKLELRVPDIDYGFTGTINGVAFTVSGTHESAGLRAWKTSAISPTPPCIWGNPNGRVTIEEFSPHILRGHYEANLISAELLPDDFRGRCPVKSVVKQLSGSFVVAVPWMDDNRQVEDTSWLREDLGVDLSQDMPFDFSIDMDVPDDEAPVIRVGDDIVTESDHEDCTCSCAEYQKGLKVTQSMMMGGSAMPSGETMRLLTCSSYCLAEVMKKDCQLDLN